VLGRARRGPSPARQPRAEEHGARLRLGQRLVRADYETAHRLARDARRDGIPADSPAPDYPHIALIMCSRPDQIRGILADGLAALDAISADPVFYARLHAAAAGCAAQTGDLEFAAAEANETLRIGRQQNSRWVIANGLYLVALTSWRAAPDDALDALEECIALHRSASVSSTVQARALALAAQLHAAQGDANGGLSALREAINAAHRNRERTAVATAFDRGIQVLASTGHNQTAAVLGGIVTEGVFATTHAVPVHELPDRQRALEHLEVELGAERYAAAIARGSAMTYDEAVDSTTRALDMLLHPDDRDNEPALPLTEPPTGTS
jgi:tetratricopeptide (TPR) repeat protein